MAVFPSLSTVSRRSVGLLIEVGGLVVLAHRFGDWLH